MSLPIRVHLPAASDLVLGFMGFGGGWNTAPPDEAACAVARAGLETALRAGITVVDCADIYHFGKSEAVLGRLLAESPGLRDSIILQTKGGIRLPPMHGGTKRYDLSAQTVTAAIDESLSRLRTDHIDVYLLHRPDPLWDPAELGQAMERARAQGKVRYFGVSNMHAGQVSWLQAHTDLPLLVNQLEMSLHARDWLEQGVLFNTPGASVLGCAPGTLEHCLQCGIQLQAWGALAQGRYSGRSLDDADDPTRATAALVASIAAEYGTSPEAVVLAWLMRHPAGIQPVIGTTSPARIDAAARASDLHLSAEHWYQLWTSARGSELP